MVGLMAVYFLTGVSGELGSRLISRLSSSAKTDRIIGIDRRPLRTSAAKLEYVQRDGAIDGVSDLIGDADVLVHLAPFSPNEIRTLLEDADKAKLKSIVFLSSAAVFGAWPTNGVPLTEDSPVRPNPGFGYAVELAESERLIYGFKAEHPSIKVAVLRMALILGGGFEQALTGPLGVFAHRHHESSRPVQYLHIDDAVSALALAAEEQLDGTFNVAPDGFIDDAKARAVAGAPPRPGCRVALLILPTIWCGEAAKGTISPLSHHIWSTRGFSPMTDYVRPVGSRRIRPRKRWWPKLVLLGGENCLRHNDAQLSAEVLLRVRASALLAVSLY